MSAVETSGSLLAQNIASSEQYTKGFLYKIKDQEGKTRGYLFGTIHKIREDHPAMHPKIFESLGKCKHLFTEISEEIFSNHGMSMSGSIEAILISRGNELRIPNVALESEQALKAAEREKRQPQERRGQAFLELLDRASLLQEDLIALVHYCKTPRYGVSADDVYLRLVRGYLSLGSVVENLQTNDFEAVSQIKSMIDFYEDLPLPEDEDKAFVKGLRPALEDKLESFRELHRLRLRWVEQVENDYISGTRSFRPYPGSESALVVEEEKIRSKITSDRDDHMLDQILRDLRHSDGKDRSFYATGADHIEGNYRNLRIKLEESGWKIVRVQM